MINSALKYFLICISGILLSLSAPGYDQWYLAWIGLCPLFIIINISKRIKEVIIPCFLFGLTYNLGYLSWLFSLHPLSWLGLNDFQSYLVSFFALIGSSAINAIFFVLFGVLVSYLRLFSIITNLRSITNVLFISLIWVIVFNKISGLEIVLGLPWTLLEYSQYKNYYLIQISEYLGSISISFLIVYFNISITNLLLWAFNVQKIANKYISKDPGQFEDVMKCLAFIIFLISLTMVTGSFVYKENQQFFSSKSKTICILQGNLPIKATRGGKLDFSLAKKTYNSLLKNNKASVIVAPEGAIPVDFNADKKAQNWLKKLSKKTKSEFIFGTYRNSDKGLFNCAVIYSLINNNFKFYEKERLVPFGEFTPLSNLMPNCLKILSYNLIGSGFKSGKENTYLKSKIGEIGVNICFELMFPNIIRKQAIQGSQLLVNLSDLSWFSNDLLKKQFISFGVFRAVENRKSLVIATNNGISAFIEPTGKIKCQSLANSRGVLINWVNLNKKKTYYAKYGW